MASLAAIREGLRAALARIDISPYTGLQVSAYGRSNPIFPTIQVLGPEEIDYDNAMQRGHDVWLLTIQAITGLVTDQGAQELLDKFLESSGSSSLKAAVESDKTLGGTVQNVRITQATGYRQYGTAPNEVLGCEWQASILA
jgi:hypothetical protein